MRIERCLVGGLLWQRIVTQEAPPVKTTWDDAELDEDVDNESVIKNIKTIWLYMSPV